MRRLAGQLYVQVIVATLMGVAIGLLFPAFGAALKPAADAFIKLIRMLLAPVIFGTVVLGIARMGNLREAGRIGGRAILYFELLSTVALAIGLLAVNILKPGAGMHVAAGSLDVSQVAEYAHRGQQAGVTGFLLDIVPDSFVGAFTGGAMLPVILLALLVGAGLARMGDGAEPLVALIDRFTTMMFEVVGLVMRLAPIGAAAGMAYTVGKFGAGTLTSLGSLVLTLCLASAFFVCVVLAGVMQIMGLSLWRFLAQLREEILIVFATCSTEAVLPQLMAKLETMGCDRATVGIVVPAGYTFNADGTCLYLSLAAVFVAQATDTPLPLLEQLGMMAVLLLTSKGSAGVAGAGFVALAATLSSFHDIPMAGLALLLGVDRLLNIPRALVNLIGNGVAVLAVARLDGSLDRARAGAVLGRAPA
ncbi:MAG: C4-dicarboxylate transporter DctA [Sphingomonas sp.]